MYKLSLTLHTQLLIGIRSRKASNVPVSLVLQTSKAMLIKSSSKQLAESGMLFATNSSTKELAFPKMKVVWKDRILKKHLKNKTVDYIFKKLYA